MTTSDESGVFSRPVAGGLLRVLAGAGIGASASLALLLPGRGHWVQPDPLPTILACLVVGACIGGWRHVTRRWAQRSPDWNAASWVASGATALTTLALLDQELGSGGSIPLLLAPLFGGGLGVGIMMIDESTRRDTQASGQGVRAAPSRLWLLIGIVLVLGAFAAALLLEQ